MECEDGGRAAEGTRQSPDPGARNPGHFPRRRAGPGSAWQGLRGNSQYGKGGDLRGEHGNGKRVGPITVRGPKTARSWLHPRWVPVGPSRGSAVASVSGVEGGGRGWRLVGVLQGWVPQPLPHPHAILTGIPRGETQKHNQKCSSKKKRHSGSRQTFLARTFPAGLQALPGSTLCSAGFWLTLSHPLTQLSSKLSSSSSSCDRATPLGPMPRDPHPETQDCPLPSGLGCPGLGVGLCPPRVLGAGISETGTMMASGVCRAFGQRGEGLCFL